VLVVNDSTSSQTSNEQAQPNDQAVELVSNPATVLSLILFTGCLVKKYFYCEKNLLNMCLCAILAQVLSLILFTGCLVKTIFIVKNTY